MKNKKVVILFIFILLMYLTACNKKEVKIKEIYINQCKYDEVAIRHKKEYWMSGFTYKNILKKNNKLTIMVNGKEYEGVYDYTRTEINNGYSYERYEGDNCRFAINKDTEKIVYFNGFTNRIKYEQLLEDNKKNEQPKSGDECYQLALDFINNNSLGIDLSKYELINDNRNSESRAIFEWRGKVDGIYTYATFTVEVEKYCDNIRFESEYLDMMDDLTLPDTYDKETIDKMVDERLNGIYSEIKDTYTIDWRAKELQYLIKLRNGKTAIICETTSYIQPNDKSRPTFSDESEFIIFLE